MTRFIGLLATLTLLILSINGNAQKVDNRYFEMRTYTCNPEKDLTSSNDFRIIPLSY